MFGPLILLSTWTVQGKSFLYREQKKTLAALEIQLTAARQQGFVSKHTHGTQTKKRPLVVIGIITTLGNKKKRDAVRQAWMGTGSGLVSKITLVEYMLQLFFVEDTYYTEGFFYCRCIVKKD